MEEKSTTPEWLRNLQESSWELEFLISGGAIFSLLQASEFYADLVQSLKITTWLPGTDLLLLLGVLGLQVLTLGFGLHLLLRAFWVAMVCVMFLYPEGARPERVRWRRPFRATPPSDAYFHQLLLRLNRTCATVMFLAITATLLLGGLMVLILLLAAVPAMVLGLTWSGLYDWYLVLMLLFLLLYLVDLVAFGALRRTPGLVWLVFPAFWLFDRLSLRVVLQPALWLFTSQVPRGRLLAGLTVFMTVALAYSYNFIYQDLHLANAFDRRLYRNQMAPGPALRDGVYLDELDGRLVRGTAIASKFIEKPFMEVFIVYRKQFELPLQELGPDHYLSDLLLLSIDDSTYQATTWYPTRKRRNDQMGLTAMVPISHLAQGPHQLVLRSRVDTAARDVIIFWKIGEK